jgi:hypothetical protein
VVVGFRREAATDDSPGLQPWVTRSQKHALKVASEVLGWSQRVTTIEAGDVRTTDLTTHQGQNRPVDRHFSSFVPHSRNYGGQAGRLICLHHPGLKPWAMVYNRFAVSVAPSFLLSIGVSAVLERASGEFEPWNGRS